MKSVTVLSVARKSATAALLALCALGAHAGNAVLPLLSVNDVSLSEGQSGVTTMSFRVSLSEPALLSAVTFDIDVAGNTATAGVDFLGASLIGQSIAVNSSFYDFNVQIFGDTDFEPTESFFVNVSNIVGALAFDTQGTGTIVNDDRAAPPPAQVPEPSSAALMALGLVAAGSCVRRRR